MLGIKSVEVNAPDMDVSFYSKRRKSRKSRKSRNQFRLIIFSKRVLLIRDVSSRKYQRTTWKLKILLQPTPLNCRSLGLD